MFVLWCRFWYESMPCEISHENKISAVLLHNCWLPNSNSILFKKQFCFYRSGNLCTKLCKSKMKNTKKTVFFKGKKRFIFNVYCTVRRNKNFTLYVSAHVRETFISSQSMWFNLKSRALTRKINICLHVNIYFSVWQSTFIHTHCVFFQCYKNATAKNCETDRMRQNCMGLWFILKNILYSMKIYMLYNTVLIFMRAYAQLYLPYYYLRYIHFNTAEIYVFANAFPVGKHHHLVWYWHCISDFDFSQTNMVDWRIYFFDFDFYLYLENW